MSDTYILVECGSDAVVNAIVWDGNPANWQPHANIRAIKYNGPWRTGWKWDGTNAFDPNPPPPPPPPKEPPSVPSQPGMDVI